VVVADSGGTSEAVVDGTTGYLVEEGDVAAMAERLETLVGDATLRARLGRAGRAFVRRAHDLPVQNERLGALLRDLGRTT
jgi:phosphatidylinositol alpha-1,6-mannosyltransferase